jgi:hypothetical protein
MLKGGLMPPTWNCEIGLGPEFTGVDLHEKDFARETNHDEQNTSNLWKYIEAPQSSVIHHFKRSSIYFLINPGPAAQLSSINIIATASTNRGDVIKVTLPVLSTINIDKTLQHLAVKSALVELEIRADQHKPHETVDDSVASQNAVFLGKLYSISSRWTNFVATNSDGSIARAIDSYDALASDLHLLTVPQQRNTSSHIFSGVLKNGSGSMSPEPVSEGGSPVRLV